MRQACLPLLLLVCCAAWAANPTVVQTIVRGYPPLGLAISPSGEQIAIVGDQGLNIHPLRSNGQIQDREFVKVQSLSALRQVAFAPNGKRIVMAATGGWVYFLNRGTWELTSTNLGLTSNNVPTSLFLLEEPSLAFLTFWGLPHVYVFDYHRTTPQAEILRAGLPEFGYGVFVAARADASRLYTCIKGTDLPLHGTVYSLPYQMAQGVVWQYPSIGEPTGCCVGPDPDHLLMTTEAEAGLYILDQRQSAQPTIGCYLHGAIAPRHVGLTNDGVYAVVNDYGNMSLTVVAGLDLRGRLDPNFNTPPKGVRTAHVDLGRQMDALALHPTRPYAYLCDDQSREVKVVKLAIPHYP